MVGVGDLRFDDTSESYRAAELCCYDEECESMPSDEREECESAGQFTYVTDISFEDTVLKQSTTIPVLMAVGATWCGHCKTILPLLRQLNLQGDVVVVKAMLSDDSKRFKKIVQYLEDHGRKVEALPTCVLFYGGEPIDALVGRFGAKKLDLFLEKQPELKALVCEWKSRLAPGPLGAAMPHVESGFERIEQLDPRIQARIRAAAEASTCSRKFG